MKVTSRGGEAINLIVIHDPEGANTARELYHYLQRIDAGYHVCCDNAEVIIMADDNARLQAAGGVNSRSLNICIVPGRAAWSREQWLVHLVGIERMGKHIAMWCKLHGIPPRLIDGDQVHNGEAGICRHKDVSVHYPESEGHTDPGDNFPLDILMQAVLGTPATANKEPDEVTVIACPNKPAPNPHQQPHAQFYPPSPIFKNGAVVLRHGASIRGSVPQKNGTEIWAPLPAKGHKWIAMTEKIGRIDEDPAKPGVQVDTRALKSKGIILIDDHGDTTDIVQGFWND